MNGSSPHLRTDRPSASLPHPVAAGAPAAPAAPGSGEIRFCFRPSRPTKSGAVRRRFAAAVNVAVAFLLCAVAQASARTVDLAALTEVGTDGVLVRSLVPELADDPAGLVKLADAPEPGRTVVMGRDAIAALLRAKAPDLVVTNWTGAASVRVSRRSRDLGEDEVREFVTAALQQEHVGDRGQLEVRFSRPWKTVPVPDEPLVFRVIDLPINGVGASFTARLVADCGDVRVGSWQILVQAKIWKDVLVAAQMLRRGQTLAGDFIRTERRDILGLRDPVTPDAIANGLYELTTSVSVGQPITHRSVRARPVVFRGAIVDGLVADGPMTISLKVEVLEDGTVGQNLRVRNLKTRREMLGKVQNEQTIVLHL